VGLAYCGWRWFVWSHYAWHERKRRSEAPMRIFSSSEKSK
jgi:hypothetical protein